MAIKLICLQKLCQINSSKLTSNRLGQARRLLLALACTVLLGILILGRPGAAAAQNTPTGFLESPGPGSYQSGIGIISGWVCTATNVVIEINGTPFDVVYGGERRDTGEVCGDTDNGFTTMAFNWNLLGDGQHTVVAKADNVEIGRATVTVTTLGAEFVRGAEGETLVQDFPSSGEAVRLVWQQSLQNFMIVGGVAPDDTSEPGIAGVGYLELPAQNSFQSGIGVISGWVCTATNVVIEINGTSNSPTYGGERTDTQDSCDDTDNGFAMAFNWSLLGDGQHTVVAKADGVEIGRATVTVTTLGAEFVRGAEGEALVQDFPLPGQSVTVEWQQAHQNFTITGVITGVSGTGTCLRTSAAVADWGFGLAKDCATLLGLKDRLRGRASLNWAETLNMGSWDGLTVSWSTPRSQTASPSSRFRTTWSGTMRSAVGSALRAGPARAATTGCRPRSQTILWTVMARRILSSRPLPPAVGLFLSLVRRG